MSMMMKMMMEQWSWKFISSSFFLSVWWLGRKTKPEENIVKQIKSLRLVWHLMITKKKIDELVRKLEVEMLVEMISGWLPTRHHVNSPKLILECFGSRSFLKHWEVISEWSVSRQFYAQKSSFNLTASSSDPLARQIWIRISICCKLPHDSMIHQFLMLY